jgi:nucleotidyltransferase substrate binding protein (TIGR01987 family)
LANFRSNYPKFGAILWTDTNYNKALKKLLEGINDLGDDPPDIVKEGIIQRFEFTHELAWKVMKDYLIYEGIQNITGSRSAAREAFNIGLIDQCQLWMDMIESRNTTVHTYREDILEKEYQKIIHDYAPLLQRFFENMNTHL